MKKRRSLASRLLYMLAFLLIISALFGVWYFFGDSVLLGWANTFGVRWGAVAGILVGAVVWPMMGDAKVSGPALLGAVLGLLGVGFYQALQFGELAGSTGGILAPSDSPLLTAFALETLFLLLYGIFGGALVTLLVSSPQHVLLGGMLGLIVGMVVGGLSRPLMMREGIDLSQGVFSVIVGIVVLSIWSTLGSRQG